MWKSECELDGSSGADVHFYVLRPRWRTPRQSLGKIDGAKARFLSRSESILAASAKRGGQLPRQPSLRFVTRNCLVQSARSEGETLISKASHVKADSDCQKCPGPNTDRLTSLYSIAHPEMVCIALRPAGPGSLLSPMSSKTGGEGGIRTHGSLHYTRFPVVLFRPLRHLSPRKPA